MAMDDTGDSNVPRASSRQSPIAQNAGDGKLADTYLKGLVGLHAERYAALVQ